MADTDNPRGLCSLSWLKEVLLIPSSGAGVFDTGTDSALTVSHLPHLIIKRGDFMVEIITVSVSSVLVSLYPCVEKTEKYARKKKREKLGHGNHSKSPWRSKPFLHIYYTTFFQGAQRTQASQAWAHHSLRLLQGICWDNGQTQTIVSRVCLFVLS